MREWLQEITDERYTDDTGYWKNEKSYPWNKILNLKPFSKDRLYQGRDLQQTIHLPKPFRFFKNLKLSTEEKGKRYFINVRF